MGQGTTGDKKNIKTTNEHKIVKKGNINIITENSGNKLSKIMSPTPGGRYIRAITITEVDSLNDTINNSKSTVPLKSKVVVNEDKK